MLQHLLWDDFFNGSSTIGGGVDAYGNDYFDALLGVPGTYLTIDSHGNPGFGFSLDLYSFAHNIIDAGRDGRTVGIYASQTPIGTRTDYYIFKPTGWVTFVDSQGNMSGILADFINYAQDSFYAKSPWGPAVIDIDYFWDKFSKLADELASMVVQWREKVSSDPLPPQVTYPPTPFPLPFPSPLPPPPNNSGP